MDNDLKMLFQVNKGDIIHIMGRLLQPFCSHALYRVKVTELHKVSDGYMVIQGTLVDFKDSPVKSYALSRVQFFRYEDGNTKLSKEDIRRVLREQGVTVRFREYNSGISVEAMAARKSAYRTLGPLAAVERMSEDALASLVRAKFDLDYQEEAEKVEELA